MATIEENGRDVVKLAQVTSFTAGSLWARNMSPSIWPTTEILSLQIGAGSLTPATFLELFFWAQATGSSWTAATYVDFAILMRHLNNAQTVGNAMFPLLVARASWLATESEHLYVASGEQPVKDASVDTSKRWNMVASFDFTQPASGDLAAQNLFESIVYQQMGKGAILQLPCKGFNEIAIIFKSDAATLPGRVLVGAKLR